MDINAIIAAKKFGKGGSGGSSGPVSWNDLTDKPFYEVTEEGEIDIVESQTLSANETNEYNASHSMSLWFDFIYGEAVTVVFDGEEYPLRFSGQGDTDMDFSKNVLFGNANIYDATKEDTGEPFVVFMQQYYPEDEPYTGEYFSLSGTMYTNAGGAEHTVRVYKTGIVTTTVPLDEKYIPDTVATKGYVEQAAAPTYKVATFFFMSDGDGESVTWWADFNNAINSYSGLTDEENSMLVIGAILGKDGSTYFARRKYSVYDDFGSIYHFEFVDENNGVYDVAAHPNNSVTYTYVPAT